MAVVIRALDLSDGAVVSALLGLQRASYAVEAALIGSTDIPALHDTPQTLARCGETFYGQFDEDGTLTGAVSYKREGDVVDLHRLVVRPERFRSGIGRTLVEHVENLERSTGKMVVSTGAANDPARSLYLSLGFKEKDEVEAAPSLRIVLFEKDLGGAAQKKGRGSSPA